MSIRDIRYGIGADILKMMDRAEDLPLPNVHLLVEQMQKYFEKEDFKEEMESSSWFPDKDYWRRHLADIREKLRKENKFFEYQREQGSYRGQWKFVNKKEFEGKMKREYVEMETRTDNFNERLEDGKERWTLNVPGLEPVPQLPRN